MKNRWIAGLLAVCMMLTVTMGSLPAMAAQDERTDNLRGENTTSEPLTTALQEAVQASLAADAAEEEQPTAEPTGKPGTSSQAAGEPIEDYFTDKKYNTTFRADLYTDASGAKVATITKVDEAGAGATVLDFPDKIPYPAEGAADTVYYTVTKICLPAFGGIPSDNDFKSVHFPNGVKEISLGNGTSRLSAVTELTIPESVTDFNGQLQNMTNLKTLKFEEGVEEISGGSIVSGCSNLTTIQLPRSLKKLSGTATFSDATALTTITLPEGIEITQGSTFKGCTALESIELPASITVINSSMFAGCTSLKSVNAKGTITKIEDNAFGSIEKITGWDDDWDPIYTTYVDAELSEIPDLGSVTEIGDRAFNGCAKLKTVDLHNVTSLGVKAFYECSALSGEIDLRGLETIPAMAFAYDENITSIRFNNKLRSIGYWAFIKARTTTIELPDTVESIGSYAFYYSKLKGALQLPDSLKTLGDGAFSGCAGIEAVDIGPNLTNIPASAFDGCTNLETVTIDNSQDNVTGTFPTRATVTYTLPSVAGAGDTIKESGMSLQDAVNAAAASGEPVKIEKNIQLKAPVTVPEGKTVVITSDARQIILGDSSHEPKNLFVIAEGASLQLEGSVELYGQYNTGSVVLNHGSFVMDGADVVIERAALENPNIGVVENDGANAVFTLKSGTIANNKVRGRFDASVRVTNGAHFKMDGGTIQNNTADTANSDTSSPAVLLFGNSSFEMNGGTISGNEGQCGTAVYLTGSSENSKAHFVMNGGSLQNNVSKRYTTNSTPTGAVFVKYSAEFLMYGGEISGNTTLGNGGGVAVFDELPTEEHGTTFKMYGGTIAGNRASGGGQSSGGGIYSFSNDVYLYGGLIQDNAAYQGGGVYSEGNANVYTTLHLQEALITGNTAKQGGGLWFCPTGNAELYMTNGAVIYGNTADQAGDDFASPQVADVNGNGVTLSDYLPNGKVFYWYKDGRLNYAGGNNYGTHGEGPRYDENTNAERVSHVKDYKQGLALKAIVPDEDLGMLMGALVITGNTAWHGGGGIGANGGVVIGENKGSTYETTVQKVWENKGYTEAQPDSVTVHLKEKYTGDVVDTVELNAGNAWKHTFADLPDSPEHYTVEEEPVDGYTARYAQSDDGSFTITNTYQTKAVSVRKVWVDNDLEFRPASVEVELAAIDRVGAFAPRTAVLSADNNWTYTFDNLPAEHTYLVTEKTQAAGYQTTITGDEGTGFVITNTYQPTPTDTPVTPPTNPDKPVTPPTTPDQPDTPVTPPTNPDTPVTPPTNPDTPVTPPTTPDQPDTPVTPPTPPDTPVTPPTTPDQPDTPVTPPTPPENPDTPVTPPTTPDNPDTPVTPPTTPDKPGTSILPPFLPLLPLIPLIPLIPWIPDEPATSAPPEQPENPPVEVPEETPEQPEETPPTSVPESEPEEPSSSSEVPENEPEEVKTPTRRLIQTGQNEWLVWVLAAAGGSFLLLGIHKRRKGKHEA